MANMSLKKTPMPEQDPKIRARNFKEVTLGYTDGTINRSKSFRLGTAEKQGLAIYLDAEKAKMLKGATIKSVLTCVATTFVEGQVLFISKDLGGTPLYTQSFKPGNASRFTTYDLTTPTKVGYTFDGWYVGDDKIETAGKWAVCQGPAEDGSEGERWRCHDWIQLPRVSLCPPRNLAGWRCHCRNLHHQQRGSL